MDAAIALARNVVHIGYDDIPAKALEITRKQILDSLAVTIGGTTAQGARELAELARDQGGKRESTILVYGEKVPAPEAALVNSTMCDALDYDDTNIISGAHSGTTIVPACFAVAERKGKVSGKEFLAAATLGVDLVHRIGRARQTYEDVTGPMGGWETTPLYGFFGTAAAAGKILGLDEEKMVNALGIAYAQASGNLQGIRDGALTKRMQPGFAARGGIVSALMAQKGLTGARNSLEGTAGLYNTYHRGSYDPDLLTQDLGKKFLGEYVCFKLYPSCRGTHSSIDATLALVKEHALKPGDVAEITAFVGSISHFVCCEPLEVKRNPKTIVDAQFSVPWTVATAIVHGQVGLKDFTAEAIKDGAVLQMAQRVTPMLEDSLSRRGSEGAIVEIRTTDGGLLSKKVPFPSGCPQNPLSWESIAAKLWECAPYAAKPIPRESLEKALKMVERLEELDDVSPILRLLS